MNTSVVNLAVQRYLSGRDMPEGEHDVPLTGVPKLANARVYIARAGEQQRVVITHVDGHPLEEISVMHVPSTGARVPTQQELRVGDIVWREPTQLIDQEVIAADNGRDVTVSINTDGKRFMRCSCGRKRYATRNNFGRVKSCHVCAKQHTRKRKTAWQQKRRSI